MWYVVSAVALVVGIVGAFLLRLIRELHEAYETIPD